MKILRHLSAVKRPAADILLLVIRLWLAKIFLTSGYLKLISWESTISLFQDEYNLPILPPEIAAYLGTGAEIFAGALVLIGFLTPFGALILAGITATIEIFVYPGTNDHYHWLMLCSVLMIYGGGRISFDKLFYRNKI